MNKWEEILSELRLVFSKRGAGVVDAIIPLLFFILGNRFFSLKRAVILSLSVGITVIIYRSLRRQSVRFILGGVGMAIIAGILAFISGTARGYYLPGFITGGLTVVVCLVSILLKHPLAAYSSALTRKWPMDWYWHEKVRPAYSEVTIFWGVAFGIRLMIEVYFFQRNNFVVLGNLRLFLGWPFTILVLIISYLYGQKRLQYLNGPSVQEFEAGKQTPWESQLRGF